MEEMYKKVDRKEIVGSRFFWQDPYSDYCAELIVDNNGNPTFASYGSKKRWHSVSREEKEFYEVVKRIMRNFLDHDIEEFKRMKRSLNEEYLDVAERLKMQAANRQNY